MTNEQQQVKEWMKAFGQETPEKPTIPSLEIRKLRAKLILEEAIEAIHGLGLAIEDSDTLAEIDSVAYINFLESFNYTPNLVDIADGCEDLKVVTEGTLVACGLVKKEQLDYDNAGCWKGTDQLFDEVMRSNSSKFWTTEEINEPDSYPRDYDITQIKAAHPMDVKERIWLVKDKDGKVIKSPSYSKANLQPIIDSL